MRKIRHKRKTDRPTKFIRINDKTMIEVDENIPVEEARANYILKMQECQPEARHNRSDDIKMSFFR